MISIKCSRAWHFLDGVTIMIRFDWIENPMIVTYFLDTCLCFPLQLSSSPYLSLRPGLWSVKEVFVLRIHSEPVGVKLRLKNLVVLSKKKEVCETFFSPRFQNVCIFSVNIYCFRLECCPFYRLITRKSFHSMTMFLRHFHYSCSFFVAPFATYWNFWFFSSISLSLFLSYDRFKNILFLSIFLGANEKGFFSKKHNNDVFGSIVWGLKFNIFFCSFFNIT